MNATTTLEQQRAADALARLREIQDHSETFRKRYRAYVERLGPMIVMNGLGQALATERAAAGPQKKEEERAHGQLYANLQRWLCRPDGGIYPNADDLLDALVRNDEAAYLRAQAEALAWLDWHKKFCQAELPRETEEV